MVWLGDHPRNCTSWIGVRYNLCIKSEVYISGLVFILIVPHTFNASSKSTMSLTITTTPAPDNQIIELVSDDKKTLNVKTITIRSDTGNLSSSSETSSLSLEKTVALPDKIGTTWSRYIFCKSMASPHAFAWILTVSSSHILFSLPQNIRIRFYCQPHCFHLFRREPERCSNTA